jgi:hypothetical protein
MPILESQLLANIIYDALKDQTKSVMEINSDFVCNKHRLSVVTLLFALEVLRVGYSSAATTIHMCNLLSDIQILFCTCVEK